MELRIPKMRLGFLLWTLSMAISLAGTTKVHYAFDRAFEAFLRENSYRGGAVAAMKDGRLLIANGYGVDRAGHEVTAHSRFHISSLAKSLTGVSIMMLVQDDRISLQDKVFGDYGILSDIRPWRDTVDTRLYEITVDHLLRHSAGWDINKAPLYDPLLNTVYLDRGHNVPNIAQDMDLPLPLEPTDLISYVMSQPLSFTPGTSVAYSNMAYLVLGRVIEAVSDMEYRDFVKKYILDPCGMWSTRLELAINSVELESVFGDQDPSIYEALDPVAVDSTLGWYSNVYDMMRFTRCTFETGQLLNDKNIGYLLNKLESPPIQHNDSWYCAGFRTNTRNVIWQDADLHADDLILYHNLNPDEDNPHKEELPDSWVVMLYDKNINHIRHYTRDLMAFLDLSPPTENLFLYDLSELHKHPMWEPPSSYSRPEFTIRYQLDEHHLSAYVAAIQDEGFTIHWLTSYTVDDHTFFLLVCRRILRPIKSEYDFVFEHGLDHRHLLKRKLQLEDAGYNMTRLHSYRSMSHHGPVSFAAVFRRDGFAADVQMKYGTNHLPEPYEKLVQMYYEKKFYPLSQTVVFHDEEQFSFIFVKDTSDKQIDFKHFYDLSPSRLAKVTMDNARHNLHLSYLNSYDIAGKFRFSAIFTNATDSIGLLETEQPQNRATEITISNLKDGLIPKFMVPYFTDDSDLTLAIYYEEQ